MRQSTTSASETSPIIHSVFPYQGWVNRLRALSTNQWKILNCDRR